MIHPSKTENHKFTLSVDSDNEACAIFAIFIQDNSPGLFYTFSDLKMNTPKKWTGDVKIKQDVYNKMYEIIDKTKPNDVFAMTNAVDTFSNIKAINLIIPGRVFVKLENLGGYDYSKFTTVVSTGSTVIPSATETLIDSGTGDIIRLTKKNLRKIMADNEKLLKQFEDENTRCQNLKII